MTARVRPSLRPPLLGERAGVRGLAGLSTSSIDWCALESPKRGCRAQPPTEGG